jgi:hypothetical protein
VPEAALALGAAAALLAGVAEPEAAGEPEHPANRLASSANARTRYIERFIFT